jgi:transposase
MEANPISINAQLKETTFGKQGDLYPHFTKMFEHAAFSGDIKSVAQVIQNTYVRRRLMALADGIRREAETAATHEAARNVELMWLTGLLVPDFKTIADFRRANGSAIRAACARFIVICGQLRLFSHAVVAIDGAKFKGVNSRDRNFTKGKLKRRVEQVEASIERYLHSLEAAHLQEGEYAEARASSLRNKIAAMKVKFAELKQLETAVLEAPDQQISITDPDARAMAMSMRGAGVVGYNVQAAVDTEHNLIVAHDVTNIVTDRTLLSPMARLAKTR